jgi:hypothetical protein
MDNNQVYMSIKEADNISLRNGAANRIVQLLKKQRYSNNENSAKRWVWELCQNAKDACNSSGIVKISIDFDEQTHKVLFKHNGKTFSMSNVLSLINQSSSKDRSEDSERKSGKFGTGFITTHLLSEMVNISGILETVSGYSKFNITLDRTGNEKNEIMTAMERAVIDLQDCIPINVADFDIDEYNTVFEYKLDEYSVQVAKDGLENLRISAPFVLAMLRDIEEISIESTGEKYRYNQELSCHLGNSTVSEIKYEVEGCHQDVYVLKLSEGNVSILTALEYNDNGIKIMPFSEQQSKLFCDFPLIGTEDFPFPVLINSQDFNPTEPRDGVFLICKNKLRSDVEIEENRQIIETACGLYRQLLEYVAKNKWDGIYNITKIGFYDKKEWYDLDWLELKVNKCKDTILHTPITHTANDSMVELLDCLDEEQIFIISDKSKEIRDKIWKLMNYIMPDSIPRKEDLHEWYRSLWPNCNRYTFKSLTKQINGYDNITTLSAKMTGIVWQDWLMDYFDLIDANKEWQDYVRLNPINILPNQNGEFCAVSKLYFDVDILEEYKNILNELGDDSNVWLLHLDFERREWFQSEEFCNEDILKLIEKRLEQADRKIKEQVFQKVVFMYSKEYLNLHVQNQICTYATKILGLESQIIEVSVISEELLQDALKYIVTSVADRISECKTIDGLAKYLNISSDEAIKFLAGFIEFVVKQDYDNLINKGTKPILPNQNGEFTIKENLFLDDEMDDILKDLAYKTGTDIRAELLMKQVFLELPDNRQKRNVDIAQYIVQYVDTNRNSKDESVRRAFKKLLIWITDNKDEAKVIFSNLYKNKHYLYDDEEIASNIKQAETLSNIMEKFDIGSTDKLEEIIRKGSIFIYDEEDATKEDITEEVLLQYGIGSEEALEKAFLNTNFAGQFIRKSKNDSGTYEYVRRILERAKKSIITYLESQEEYDLSEIQEISDTIFVVKKEGKQIYVLARPSDGGEIRIYYRTEMDILDYSMDWELWVENGKTEPQKITFGKMIKLTGLNRIPLKGM